MFATIKSYHAVCLQTADWKLVAYHVHILNSRDVQLGWSLLSNFTIQHGYELQMGSYNSLPCSYFGFAGCKASLVAPIKCYHTVWLAAMKCYHTAWLWTADGKLVAYRVHILNSITGCIASLVAITIQHGYIWVAIEAYRVRWLISPNIPQCSLVAITKYISAYRLRNRRQYKKASLIVIIRSTRMYIFAWNLGK